MSSVFIDSNVIIRYFAGDTTAKTLLEPIFYGDEQGYINSIVFSEVIFVVVKLLTGRKAYELKKSRNSQEYIRQNKGLHSISTNTSMN